MEALAILIMAGCLPIAIVDNPGCKYFSSKHNLILCGRTAIRSFLLTEWCQMRCCVQWSSPTYACRERKKAEVVDRIDKYMGGISCDVPDPDNPAKLVAIKLRRKISAMADNVTTVCSFTHLFEVTRT